MARGNAKYLQMAAYVFIGVIFIFVIGATRNCGRLSYSPKEGFSGGDTIDIALMFAPGSYYLYEDSLTGINYELAENFSQQTNSPIKIWPLSDAADGFAKLETGAFDAVASLPLDNYIKDHYKVSESVFLDRLVLIQLADSVTGETPVNSSLDLNGKRVYVSPGSSALKRISNLSEEIGGNIEILEADDLSDELLSLKVASGEIPLAVVNERVAKEIAKKYPDLKYDSSVSFTQFQVWIFNKSDSILPDKFDSWLKDFKQTENYLNIISKF